jgi:hypothetical protein
MLNVFKYYEVPTSLNRADLIQNMDLLTRIHHFASATNAKEILDPVINIIRRDPELAYEYAYFVIDGRFPEAESALITNPEIAADYARYIIKDRWIEAEPIIKTKSNIWRVYKKYFNITE